MNFEINSVETKADLLRFIKSQWNFYNGDRNFVPPIIAERLELIDSKKNPFFLHSKMKLFLAKSGNKVVGRIAAIINGNHLATYKDDVGFFGFFESINDQEVANALFDKAAEWLRSQGLSSMRGPANPSMNDDVGTLIEGFDSPPVIMMPYNPAYYPELYDKYGFVKKMDLFAYLLEKEDYMTDKLKRLHDVVRQRYGITIREMNFRNKKQFMNDVATVKNIYNSAWEPNWGFVKMTDEEFNHLAKGLKQVAEQKLAFIAEINGKPVGFTLALPDININLIHNKSGSLLGALWHILTKKKKINMLRIIVLGILPEYQKIGIDAVMFYETGVRGISLGIEKGEASFILESNTMMNRAATMTMNGKLYKKYRIYEKKI